MISLKHLVFIRHATSEKTLEDRHGGEGKPLTKEGNEEANLIADWLMIRLNHIVLDSPKIYCSRLPQVIETAKIISEKAKLPLALDDRLRNIHLGVLAGLTREEAARDYPEAAEQLERWRRGELSIEQVNIPAAENLEQFHRRVYDFIEDLCIASNITSIIIVGTRSVGVMITNILSGIHSFSNSSYMRYSFDPASISVFKILDLCRGEVSILNSTTHLPTPPRHPDV